MTEPSIEAIQSFVARFHGIAPEDLVGPCRKRRVTDVRHAALYLCHLLRSDLSAGAMARLFVLDRSTVRQAWRETEKRAADDPWFGAYIATLRRAIVVAGDPYSAKPAVKGPPE